MPIYTIGGRIMKRLICLLVLILSIWIITLKDDRQVTAKDVSAGRWGLTVTYDTGEKETFPWWNVKSVRHVES